MDIMSIEGKHIKISKRSITIKENEKTCGVVTDCVKFKDIQPNKTIDYWKQLKSAGIWGSNANLIDCAIYHDGKMYYINNLKPLESYEKFFSDETLYPNEKKHYKERIEAAEKAKQYFTVIDCYID